MQTLSVEHKGVPRLYTADSRVLVNHGKPTVSNKGEKGSY